VPLKIDAGSLSVSKKWLERVPSIGCMPFH
jgi:hypothetical protein